jgi:hypothetical protein
VYGLFSFIAIGVAFCFLDLRSIQKDAQLSQLNFRASSGHYYLDNVLQYFHTSYFVENWMPFRIKVHRVVAIKIETLHIVVYVFSL